MVIGYLGNGRGNALVERLTAYRGGTIRLIKKGLDPATTEAIVWGMDGRPDGGGTFVKQAIEAGIKYWHIDRAYLGAWDQPNRVRITEDSTQLNYMVYKRPSDRFDALNIEIKPWHTGSHIIVVPPSATVIEFFGEEAATWLNTTLAVLKQCTDREIMVRAKSNFKDNPAGRLRRSQDYHDSLLNAHAVVGFSSSGLVEAVIAGVPIFATKHSAAFPVSSDDITKIEEPYYPDNRREWCNHIAYGQFTRHEIKGYYGDVVWPILRGLK